MDINKQSDDTVGEEVSAVGQRIKGAAKDLAGNITNDRELEREGERDNAIGRSRQANNNVMDETDGVRGATVGQGKTGGGVTSPRCIRRPKRPREPIVA